MARELAFQMDISEKDGEDILGWLGDGSFNLTGRDGEPLDLVPAKERSTSAGERDRYEADRASRMSYQAQNAENSFQAAMEKTLREITIARSKEPKKRKASQELPSESKSKSRRDR
jgi:hypothetical protein